MDSPGLLSTWGHKMIYIAATGTFATVYIDNDWLLSEARTPPLNFGPSIAFFGYFPKGQNFGF